MASFNDIEIKSEVRPCFINGKKAIFHLWVKKYDIFKNEYFNGLVEYEKGTIYCLDENFKDIAIKEIGEEELTAYLKGEWQCLKNTYYI